MKAQLPYYRKALNDKLVERIERNPKYSLRAFAKAIGLDSSALSQMLSGKRFMSDARAQKLLDRLDLSVEDREQFLSSLASARVDAGFKRMSAAQRTRVNQCKSSDFQNQNRELTIDQFKMASDWYHYAILELTKVKGFQSNPTWIAKRLGINDAEAIAAIDRLTALELIEEIDGKLTKTSLYLDSANKGVSSAAHRRRQKQIIEKSLHALEHYPIEIRNHSARTVAIAPHRIKEAKVRIEKFMMELCDELGATDPDQVYELSVQLFPLEANPLLTQNLKSNSKGELK